jgi:hypothetical protein
MENELDNEVGPKTDSLEVTPQNIDFGCLSPGQGGIVRLNVRGGPGNVTPYGDHFKVAPTSFNHEGCDIELTLLGGSSGELIWDEIVLQTDVQEIRVPVTARWEVRELERPVVTAAEAPVIQMTEAETYLKDKRTFKGRACSRCGKNFAYDANSRSWEECTCTWYQVIRNMSVRIFKDLRYGVKEFPSYVQEIWHIILGKEKW